MTRMFPLIKNIPRQYFRIFIFMSQRTLDEFPPISIVTNVFNAESFISRLYHSLCLQDVKDFEWIVVDDFSTDSTVEIVRGFYSPGKYGLKLFRLPFNTGGPGAAAVGISKCCGRWIVKIDHDDELHAGALAQIIEYTRLAEGREDIAGVLFKSIQSKGNIKIQAGFEPGMVFDWHKFSISRNKTLDGVLAIKNEIAKKFNALPERQYINLHSAVLLRMALKYKFIYGGSDPILTYHRDNTDSQTNRVRISDKTVYSYSKILNYSKIDAFKRPLMLLKKASNLVRFSFLIHGRPFYCLRYFDSGWAIWLVLLASPIGILQHFVLRRPEVKSYSILTAADVDNLKDLRAI